MKHTFTAISKIVAPALMAYKDDLVKHDKHTLESYEGPFIYGYRSTGTNLLKLLPKVTDWFGEQMMYKPLFNPAYKVKDIEEARKILHGELAWITYHNADFLYYDGHRIVSVTKDHVTALWTNYVNKLT